MLARVQRRAKRGSEQRRQLHRRKLQRSGETELSRVALLQKSKNALQSDFSFRFSSKCVIDRLEEMKAFGSGGLQVTPTRTFSRWSYLLAVPEQWTDARPRQRRSIYCRQLFSSCESTEQTRRSSSKDETREKLNVVLEVARRQPCSIRSFSH